MKLKNSLKEFKKFSIPLTLFLFTSVLFLYTLHIRKEWFGTISPWGNQWLTGSTLEWSKNWYYDGPVKLKFALLRNPSSVEFGSLVDREIYYSYPPGQIMPIYFISKVLTKPPSLEIVMAYNLLTHYLIALSLGWFIYWFLTKLRVPKTSSAIFASITISLELLLPGLLYWHQNVYAMDQAVLLPFVFAAILETLRSYNSKGIHRKLIDTLLALIMFYGVLTDWLFVLLIFVIYIKRMLFGEFKKSIPEFLLRTVKFFFPLIFAISLYAMQIYSFGLFPDLAHKFLFRTSLTPEGAEYTKNFFDMFWMTHVRSAYGLVGVITIFASLLVYIICMGYVIREKNKKTAISENFKQLFSVISLFTLPFFVQILIFSNHSVIHPFTAQKLGIFIALAPFVLLPLLVYVLKHKDFKDFNKKKIVVSYGDDNSIISLSIITLILVAVTTIYLLDVHPMYKKLFPKPEESFVTIGNFIAKNTDYYDVVFSDNYEIAPIPPQQLGLSEKLVYRVTSVEEICNKVGPLKGDYVVKIFSISTELKKTSFKSLELGVIKKIKDEKLRLYEVDKKYLFQECVK